MTKPLVLVVEDEAPLLTLLRYNLEREGFRVCEARDGSGVYVLTIAPYTLIKIEAAKLR